MIDLLARPIVELLGTLGHGIVPTGGPADVIRTSSAAIDAAQSLGRLAVSELSAQWNGDAATAAISAAERAHTSAVALADHGNDIAAVVDRACEATRAGFVELQGILDSFVGIAIATAPLLATPAGQTMIVGAAIEHLERAMAVVARVRAELAEYTAEVSGYTTPPPVPDPAGTAPASVSNSPVTQLPLSTAPAAASPDAGSEFTRAFAQSIRGAGTPSFADTGMQSFLNTRPSAAVDDTSTRPPGPSGNGEKSDLGSHGVEVRLPDGSTALAPNEQAAGAVRSALSQQGVPYSWGGTEPGRGLDCSGLTQWAYGEQGVELPRLAQEQNIGTPVSSGDLMPGDLAVWDGHVAMVIGNNQLVEAGDPVQVGPIRTSNSGMGFKGFYRPTLAP